jgi:hypothetical protein
MNRPLVLLALTFVVVVAASSESRAQWVLYDDFSTSRISRDKWVGTQTASDNMEIIRNVERGVLHLFNRTYGGIGSDNGFKQGTLRIEFPDPDMIKGFRARVRIMDYETEGCATSQTATSTRLRLHGHFFNTVSPQGNPTNDVVAYIGVRSQSDSDDPPNTLRVVTSIWRCLNAACSADNVDLDIIDYREIGTVQVGVWTTLGIEWNPAKHRFVFRLGNSNIPVSYAGYLQEHGLEDEELPGYKSKSIQATEVCPNCSTPPRSTGSLDAYLDNIYVK